MAVKSGVFVWCLLSSFALLWLGCPAPDSGVTIAVSARVGEKAFACGQTYEGLGKDKATFKPHDLRMFVSNVRLLDSGGKEIPLTLTADGKWQNKDVVLLDFENKTGECTFGTPETNGQIKGSLPEGTDASSLKGLKFTLGVPFALNHSDQKQAKAPMDNSGTFWSWQLGYKFFRLDGLIGSKYYRFHIGSLDCKSDPSDANKVLSCTYPNRAEIHLKDFVPGQSSVLLDVAKITKDIELAKHAEQPTGGCQTLNEGEEPFCAPQYAAMGMKFKQASPTPDTQTAFSVGAAK